MTTDDLKFYTVIPFVFSVFLISTDDTLKIASMNVSSIVAILMINIFFMDVLLKGRFTLQKHPVRKYLCLLLLSAAISLLASKFDTSKTIPDEAYSYVWTTGLNTPGWRGWSFLVRLFLSIFAVEFIVSAINTEKKYFSIINIFIWGYMGFCFLIFLQILFFFLGNIEIGYIYPPITEGYFRFGGYVGEPGTLAGILLSGFFLIIASIWKNCSGIWFSRKTLIVALVLATIDLIFTFSTAIILGVTLTFLFIGWRFINKKVLLGFMLLIIGIYFIFQPIFEEVIFSKITDEFSNINARTFSWMIGWNIFTDNPLLGVGIGQSPFMNSRYLPSDWGKYLRVEDFFPYDTFRHPPMNTYIQLAAETGLLGLGILLLIFYETYKMGKSKERSNTKDFVKLAWGGGLIAYAIASNSGPDNFYVGYLCLILSMYIAGNLIFRSKPI